MSNEKQKIVSLLSGGADSVVATAIARSDFDVALALTFDYGQRAATREIDAAARFCETYKIRHRVIALPWLGEATSTALVKRTAEIPFATPSSVDTNAQKNAEAVWVPNRNAVFISIAAAFAESIGSRVVVAGFNSEEARTFPDNSSEFIDATNRALGFSTKNRVRVLCPTSSMNKKEIARSFAKLSLNPDAFWSCYDGGEIFCGRCESCARAIRAFTESGNWNLVKHRFPLGNS